MPKFFSVGIATSARHVVGLHDPPKNTSGPVVPSVGFNSFLLVLFNIWPFDGPLVLVPPAIGMYALSFRNDDAGSGGHCVLNRFKSAASTQNSPNVKPFMCLLLNALFRASKPLLPRRANNFAVCNISLTWLKYKKKWHKLQC